MEKSSPKIWDISVIFIKRTKTNNDPMGENSPNLVTLVGAYGSIQPPFKNCPQKPVFKTKI
jgi:hypothetical protein